MENKNILPIIAVFSSPPLSPPLLFGWFLTQSNKSSDVTNPSADLITPVSSIDLFPDSGSNSRHAV